MSQAHPQVYIDPVTGEVKTFAKGGHAGAGQL